MKTTISVNRATKDISLRDITDQWNMPTAYNKLVRGFNRVADYIDNHRSELEEMSMYQVIDTLDKVSDLRFRSYCAMD